MRQEAESRPGVKKFLLALIITIAALMGLSQQARAGGFCEPTEIREYAPPLKGMRPLPQPPYGEQGLPYGPPNLEILQVGFSGIAVEGGQVGFYMDGFLKRPQHLGWEVETKLSAVDRRGRIKQILRQRDQWVGTVKKLSAVKLAFRVGKAPRFYLVDATIRNRSGKKLVHYADYFRVMPRRVAVLLGLNATSYWAGEVLLMRLENLSTVGISFGYEFGLDVWDGSSWTASSAVPSGWLGVGLGIGAGQTQQCQRFPLVDDLSPGWYRLTKSFSTSLGGPFSHVARARFEVVP